MDTNPSILPRPKSAFEVAQRARNEDFFLLMREFLDSWYVSRTKPEMIEKEPGMMEDIRYSAYLAGACRHLCTDYNLDPPKWCRNIAKWQLKDPYFPCGIDDLRPRLIFRSPPEFIIFNVFPGKNPLFRPLKLWDTDHVGSRYMPEGFEASE